MLWCQEDLLHGKEIFLTLGTLSHCAMLVQKNLSRVTFPHICTSVEVFFNTLHFKWKFWKVISEGNLNCYNH